MHWFEEGLPHVRWGSRADPRQGVLELRSSSTAARSGDRPHRAGDDKVACRPEHQRFLLGGWWRYPEESGGLFSPAEAPREGSCQQSRERYHTSRLTMDVRGNPSSMR